MKTYKSNNNANDPMIKRVKKVHAKAKRVGLLYFLGALALLALACMPTLIIDGAKLWVVDFWKPYEKLIGGEVNIFALTIATLYLFVVISALFNFLRALKRLGALLGKNYRKVGKIKRNMQAMDEIGKFFSGTFAAIIIFHFLIYILSPLAAETTRPAIELNVPLAYATVGVGLFVHFFAGIGYGKVSNFQVNGQVAQVVEEKRECGMFVFFFRNLLQIACVGGILYFFTEVCNLNSTFVGLVDGTIFSSDLMSALLPAVIKIVAVICIIVLIKHATATTEYNLYGMQGSGILNFRVFSFFTFLLLGGLYALGYLETKTFAVDSLFITAMIAFVGFLVDCIFKPREKKEKKAKKDKKKQGEEETDIDAILNKPMMAQMPVPMAQTNTTAQSGAQPIYVPIYYPVPQQPAPYPYPTAPVNGNVEPCVKPAPAPAPAYLQPTPAPTEALNKKTEARAKRVELQNRKEDLKHAKAEIKTGKRLEKKNKKAEKKLAKKEMKIAKKQAALATVAPVEQKPLFPVVNNLTPVVAPAPVVEEEIVAPVTPTAPIVEEKVEREEMNEIVTPLDPNKQWNVRCPRCGKLLRVREVSPYHRCPSCDRVFQIRKFETYTKKD